MSKNYVERQKDFHRTLAALTRARAGSLGYRLSRGGQEITPEGLAQTYLHRGGKGKGASGVGFKVEVDPGGPEGIPYHMDLLQGYGATRGNPLRLHNLMREEVMAAHRAAGVPMRVTAIPGTSMADPRSFHVKISPKNELIVTPKWTSEFYPTLNAMPMWAGLRGKHGYTHYLNTPFGLGTASATPITHDIRRQMRSGTMPASTTFVYDYDPSKPAPRVVIPKSMRGSATAARRAPPGGYVGEKLKDLENWVRANPGMTAALLGTPVAGLTALSGYELMRGDQEPVMA
jgi:hypothetical protein